MHATRIPGMVVVYAVAAYLLAGLVVGSAFVLSGLARALGSSIAVTPGARLLLLPGAILLWPLVLRRWIGGPRA